MKKIFCILLLNMFSCYMCAYAYTLNDLNKACEEYAKYRLDLPQAEYEQTRDIDYNILEETLLKMGATKVDEYANCHNLNNYPPRTRYIGSKKFENVRRCVTVKFIYNDKEETSGWCTK